LQAYVSAVFLLVANAVSKKSLQIAVVESDDVVEQIAAPASHPALSDSVLPGTSNGGPHTGDRGTWEWTDSEMLRVIPGLSNCWSDAG
jgi:hypothetical protein